MLKNRLPKYLEELENESIYILREACAQSENPTMLYSMGKDSSVLLHLARKAFFPGKLPMQLLHVDTGWKFKEMITFRDQLSQQLDNPILIYQHPEVQAGRVSPLLQGSAYHTEVSKTQALRLALEHYQFDCVFGGARRDEEKSRAKERVYSFRNTSHQWDPKAQRPEPWGIMNGRKRLGESFRVFPLSNWTELDIWYYIWYQNIPVVPLYFAKVRPVVQRSGQWIMQDDERLELKTDETLEYKQVRFRTLGCYPLTGATESCAENLEQIIEELEHSRYSERQGRLIDYDDAASMEKKKREGYF